MCQGNIRTSLQALSGALLIAICLLQVLRLLLGNAVVDQVSGVALGVYFIVALTRARLSIAAICIALLTLTALVLLRWGHHQGALYPAVNLAMAFASFLAALQVLKLVAEADSRMLLVQTRSRELTRKDRRLLALLASHFFGAILSIGAFAIMAPILAASDPEERKENAESALQGLGFALLWSPFFVAVAVVTAIVPGLKAWQTISSGLVMAFVGMTLSICLFNRSSFGRLVKILAVVMPLILASALLSGIVLILSYLTGWNTLEAIGATFPLLGLILLGNFNRYPPSVPIKEFHLQLSHSDEEILLVGAAMFFGQAIVASPEIPELLAGLLPDSLSPLFYIVFAAFIVPLAALLGVHPLITISIVIPTLVGIAPTVWPFYFSTVVLIGWAASVMISPWIVPVISASRIFSVSPWRLTFGTNLLFAFAFIAIMLTFILVIYLVLT